MRKQTKIAAIVSAAALLAIGASMASFAATGWVEEAEGWRYYDRDGYAVTEQWRQNAGQWFWLDENGYMATNRLLESADDNGNTYYVGASGARVTNQWVIIADEDANYYWYDDENEAGYNYYYFQASGKAYKTSGPTSFKLIDGKYYAFDGDGRMLYGWVGENSDRIHGDDAYQQGVYYCGEITDGARVTNDWRKLYVGNYGPANSDSQDDSYWFYFGANGKKVQGPDSNGNPYQKKSINGKNYVFDENGIMMTTWYDSETSAASILGFFGDEEDGSRHKGWFYKVPSEAMDQSAYNDDSKKWFYANNDGSLVNNQLKTINGKKYGFDVNGEMISGLYAIQFATGSTTTFAPSGLIKIDTEDEVNAIKTTASTSTYAGDVYYFGSSDDGAMKVGNQTVIVDGNTYQFSFGRSGSTYGKGINGFDTKTKTFYVDGKRVAADADYRYQVIEADLGDNIYSEPKSLDPGTFYYKDRNTIKNPVAASQGKYYLINVAGRQMTGSTYKDAEGRVYVLEKGVVTEVYWNE